MVHKQEINDALEVYKRNMAFILGDKSEQVKIIETCQMLADEVEDYLPEIIRCKDCKWCEEKYDSLDKIPYCRCRIWESEIDPDGFCYEAKRRTDG